jgi:hypothetical protein
MSNSSIQSEQVAQLFKDKNFAYLAMLMMKKKDGSPQVTPVWVDVDNDINQIIVRRQLVQHD